MTQQILSSEGDGVRVLQKISLTIDEDKLKTIYEESKTSWPSPRSPFDEVTGDSDSLTRWVKGNMRGIRDLLEVPDTLDLVKLLLDFWAVTNSVNNEGELFNAVELDGTSIHDFELLHQCSGVNGDYRLYVNPDRENDSFEAVVLEFHSCGSGEPWEDPDTIVHRVIEVSAMYDGIRHVWIKDADNEGYLFWPDIPCFVELFQKLREYELEISTMVREEEEQSKASN